MVKVPTRRRALFVVSHCPSPDAQQAGHKTAFRFLSELAKDHDVDLVLLIKAADAWSLEQALPHLRSKTEAVTVIFISEMGRALSWVLGLYFGLAPRFCSRLSFNALIRLKEMFVKTTYDLVWAEFSQSFWVVKLLSPSGPDVLLSLHDIQTQLVSSKSLFERLLTLGLTFESEKTLLMRAGRVRVQSASDRWLLHTLFRLPQGKIEVSEPSLSLFLAKVNRSSQTIEPHSLLFWGAMGRPENSDAIMSFIRNHFGNLKQRYSDAKLYVVGSNPPKELLAMANSAILVTGFVDDPGPYFERAGLGVAPLMSGAGIKVKVLEMLRAGIPVISTPIGAEGVVDNIDILTVVENDAFGEAIDAAWKSRENIHG